MNGRLATDAELFLSRLDEEFTVSLPELKEITHSFHKEMEEGLAGRKSALKMIPSFVGRPTGDETGRFLALDLGGTNLRVLDVILAGNGAAGLKAADRFVIPPDCMRGSGEDIFHFIADSVKGFLAGRAGDAPAFSGLAFTFSFPVEQLSLSSGKLINWTKGFTATGVVGRDVAALLSEALKRKGLEGIRVDALTNDTVGTLAAGSYSVHDCDIGVILGTGTNACYAEKANRIGKLPRTATPEGEMIINMEWGNFDRVRINPYDQALDAASSNPGEQRLEKMVSGLYIGEIARLVIVEMTRQGLLFSGADPSIFSVPYSLSAEKMALATRGDDFPRQSGGREFSVTDRRKVLEIFRVISRRSARLAAASIAAVALWMDSDLDRHHTVAIDGSLFREYPGFHQEMRICLTELLENRSGRITFHPVGDGSGIGAAIVAAVGSSGRTRRSLQ